MSKKKTMSKEEKLDAMEELLFEKAEPFTLKELEKLGQKEKGVRSMVIKETIDELIGDSRILSDKIGATNFYWLFPSQAYEMKKKKLHTLEETETQLNEKKQKLIHEMDENSVGREPSDERNEKLSLTSQLQKEINALNKEISVYQSKDPELVEKKVADKEICKQAANIWTDNIFTMVSYCKKTLNKTNQEIYKAFQIPEELDNL
eukprot:gene1905-1045_t